MSFVVKNLPPPIDEAIESLAGGAPIGRNGQKHGWAKTMLVIGALGPDIAVPALDLWQSAQRIATLKHHGDLRSGDSAKALFFEEFIELERLLDDSAPMKDVLNRLSNLAYYAVYQYAQDYDIRDFRGTMEYVCKKADIPVIVAMRVAAAKYLDRSMREVKDVPAEEEAMLRVYEQFSKLVTQPLDSDTV